MASAAVCATNFGTNTVNLTSVDIGNGINAVANKARCGGLECSGGFYAFDVNFDINPKATLAAIFTDIKKSAFIT
jgi:hypothetical protein